MIDAAVIVTLCLVMVFLFLLVSNFRELVEMFKEIFHRRLK